MATLGPRFDTRGGKGVVIAIGVALAVALSTWGTQNNFSIRSFGPIAAGMFMIILFFGFYTLLKRFFDKDLNGKSFAGVASFVLIWYLANAISPELITFIRELPMIGPFISVPFVSILTSSASSLNWLNILLSI